MNIDKTEKGVFYGIFAVILIGLQPIVANARPAEIDAYIFAAFTISIEALIFLPIMVLERANIKKSLKNEAKSKDKAGLLDGWKKNKLLLIYIGISFAIAQVLFFIGYRLAGSINGSLTQKTTVIFGLLFGYLINNESVSILQIIFSLVLFFGLALAITQGSFNVLEFNVGVLILLIMAIIWMLAHAITKPIFDRNEATPSQMVFIRNAIGGIFLMFTYLIFYPASNFLMVFDPLNLFFFVIMGINYGVGLFFWYLVLKYLGTGKGTAMVSGTPLVTAIFAVLLLGEPFTLWHLIGMVIVIVSIIFIVRPQKKSETIIYDEP